LGEVLSSERSLISILALEGCSVGNDGVKALFSKLPKESPLISLNLAGNDLSMHGSTLSYLLLIWLPRTLHTLDLSGNPKLGDAGALLLSQAINEGDTTPPIIMSEDFKDE